MSSGRMFQSNEELRLKYSDGEELLVTTTKVAPRELRESDPTEKQIRLEEIRVRYRLTQLVTDEESSQGVQSYVKLWQYLEIECLLDIRIGMESQFQSHKSHQTLWGKVQQKLQELGWKATAAQIENKWKNVKRQYYSILNSNNQTGNSVKSMKLYEKLDQHFGTKPSTRPKATWDSHSSEGREAMSVPVVDYEQANRKVDGGGKGKGKRKGTKRLAQSSLVDLLEKHELEVQKRHTDKMERLDKFLDILANK